MDIKQLVLKCNYLYFVNFTSSYYNISTYANANTIKRISEFVVTYMECHRHDQLSIYHLNQ